MAIVTRVLISVVTLALSLAVADVALQGTALVSLRDYRERVAPDYPISFFSRGGRTLDDKGGYLKMVHAPGVSYRNAPLQNSPYFSTDIHGYRTTPAREGPRVVLTGGSTAFGTGIEGDEKTFASLLGPLTNTRVINGAVNGYLSRQELILFISELVDLSPTIVVSVSGFNDFSTNFRRFDHLVEDQGFEQIDQELEDHHRLTTINPLIRFSRSALQLFYPQIVKRVHAWKAMSRAQYEDIEESSRHYAQNMIKLNRFSGDKLLVVIQPLRDELVDSHSYSDLVEAYRHFRKLVTDALTEAGVPWRDSGGEMTWAERDHFMDQVHLSPSGHRAYAALLAGYLEQDKRLMSDHASQSAD